MTLLPDSLLSFLAGVLLPSLAYFFHFRKVGKDASASNEGYDTDDDDDLQGEEATGACSTWNIRHAPYKMVFCVNTNLSMGKGKIAAQCCHAAVGCYKRATKQCPAAVHAWEQTGCAKIALKCPSPDDMEQIAVIARAKGIPTYLVEDAGRTQIAAGSRTVLGLGPAPLSVFEGVSDHLKLM